MNKIRVLGILLVLSGCSSEAKMKNESISIPTLKITNAIFEKQKDGVSFPIKGSGISWYQYAGHKQWKQFGKPKSNWTWFEKHHKVRFLIDRTKEPNKFLRPASPIDYGHTVGNAADGWNRMFDDIERMKELGLNSWRFDVPWTDLNPVKGKWNEEAFALFDRYIDALIANDIQPMITFYHWVHPIWFQKLGGWEKEENIFHFVTFCKEVFGRFGHKVQLWCTINEPTVVSACGYVLGTHAHGHGGMAHAGTVLGHLLKAHCLVYKALKQMPHGVCSNIGIVHQMLRFQSVSWIKASNPIASLMNFIFGHDVVFHFFKTGQFAYDPSDVWALKSWMGINPMQLKAVRYTIEDAPGCNDFIGLNFYSRVPMSLFGPTSIEGRPMTDMQYPMWPEALYEAIHEISVLGKPIYITENGISDAQDQHRENWIIGYTNAAHKARKEGIDLAGFYYWSLVDNFEWNMGHVKKFGLYEVDTLTRDPRKKERRLRKGSHAYRDYVKIDQRAEKSGSESMLQSPSIFPSKPSSITQSGSGS